MKRRPRTACLLLTLVLWVNGMVTTSAWAALGPVHSAVATPVSVAARAGAMHAHCGAAAQTEDLPMAAGAPQSNNGHPPSSSGDCCDPGSCHCVSMVVQAMAGAVPLWASRLLLQSADDGDQQAAPSPAPVRLLRPPIH
jgi:hypothetical protein